MLAYTHKRIGITKLIDFFSLSFFTPVKNLKISDFLDIKIDDKTNLERIFLYYTTDEERSKNQQVVDAADLLLDSAKEVQLGKLDIKFGTVVYLPEDKLYIDFLEVSQSLNVENYTTFTAFLAEEYLSLVKSPYYIPLREDKYSENLRVMYPNIRVFLWSKTLRQTEGDYKLEGDLIDITSFVQTLTISQTKTGGNFQILLLPVLSEFNGGFLDISKYSLTGFSAGENTEVFNIFTSHHKIKDGFLKRQQYFFHNLIQSNDIIFISFEGLEIETAERAYRELGITTVENYAGLGLDPKDLPGNVFDMIGLVDTNSLSSVADSNEIQISITGRDVIKTLIEDGCYFYPQLYSQSLFSNLQEDKNIIDRIAGVLISPLILSQRTIQDTLDLIFSVLKTIRVCDDNLFSGYESTSGKYSLDSETEKKKDTAREKINSDRDSILEDIYNSRVESGLTNELFENDLFVVNSLFYDLQSFVQFLIDSSFVEVEVDVLVGWSDAKKQFVYLDETIQPNAYPFSFKNTFFTSINDSTISSTVKMYSYLKSNVDLDNYESKVSEEELRGIWKVVRFIYDESIASRIVVDTSIGIEKGSILSFIQKVCQEPFVEFFGDTYADRYVFTVRQPPFTRDKIKDLLKYAIDVADSDILSDSPQYSEEDIYSWYKLEPRGLIGGAGSDMTLAYLSAVYFPEYAEIWGSRPLDISHNYIPFLSNTGDGSGQSLNKWELQAVYDLKFLIDIYSYVPFTRRSTIVINGDRRIKRGTFIRLKNKGEVAYVDEVSNSFMVSDKGIDRVTTLSLSRIMVEELVEGITIDGQPYSYFDIIDTSINEMDIKASTPPEYAEEEYEEEKEVGPYNPVIGKVTSPFGQRHHPLDSDSAPEKFHNGTDIAVKSGTAIKSPWDGTIVSKFKNSVGGNQIVIEHTNGYRTGYAHLQEESIFFSVSVGKVLSAGEVFAHSGSTGQVTGPHLHFTLKLAQGELLDPQNIFDFKTERVPEFETVKSKRSVLVKEGTSGTIPNEMTKGWKVNKKVFQFFLKRRQFDYV